MAEQITINVTDQIPAINQATIDLSGETGNTYAKSQLDEKLKDAKSGIRGNATQSNAPTPYDVVTYPNGLFETYQVREPLTMPNSWGSTVTQEELDANNVFFDVKNGVISKSLSKKTNGKDAYQSYLDTTTDSPVKTEVEWVSSLGVDPKVNSALFDFVNTELSDTVDTSGTKWISKVIRNDGVLLDDSGNRSLEIINTGNNKLTYTGFKFKVGLSQFPTIMGKKGGSYFVLLPSSVSGEMITDFEIDIIGYDKVWINQTNERANSLIVIKVSISKNIVKNSVKNFVLENVIPTVFDSGVKIDSLDLGVNFLNKINILEADTIAKYKGFQSALGNVNSFRYIAFKISNFNFTTGNENITNLKLILQESEVKKPSLKKMQIVKIIELNDLNILPGSEQIITFDLGEVVTTNGFFTARLESKQNFRFYGTKQSLGEVNLSDFDSAIYSLNLFSYPVSAINFMIWCSVGLSPIMKGQTVLNYNLYSNSKSGKALKINPYLLSRNLGKISLRNLYTVTGRGFRIFTNSIFSGLNPIDNFSVNVIDEVTGSQKFRGDFFIYDSFNAVKNLTTKVYDVTRNKIDEKITKVFSKTMPTKLKDNSADYPVWFFGDSLITNNQNLIGAEFLRMLNTTDSSTQIDTEDKSIKTPTLGIAGGKIRLVGENGDASNKYSNVNAFYNAVIPLGSIFNNPASPNPNEYDSDGFSKRMDMVWYLQKICGTGKYPKLIVFGIGANDIAFNFMWGSLGAYYTTEQIRIFIGKIKDACDTIAGGTSNVSIVQLTHQYYPNKRGNYEDFENDLQHRIWTDYYDLVEKMMVNDYTKSGKKISDFTRLCDASSRFDIDNGYTYVPIRVNDRLDKMTDYVFDTTHMGTNGAYQYADALIDDFLYHDCD